MSKKSYKSIQNQVEAILHLDDWETRGIKEEDQQMQSNKLNFLATKRKGDISHGTHTKHQLQRFKTSGMIP
jgi:hypothetical protein